MKSTKLHPRAFVQFVLSNLSPAKPHIWWLIIAAFSILFGISGIRGSVEYAEGKRAVSSSWQVSVPFIVFGSMLIGGFFANLGLSYRRWRKGGK